MLGVCGLHNSFIKKFAAKQILKENKYKYLCRELYPPTQQLQANN
jgi:hypothetical protein